jgi:hypothetical protein
MIKAVSNFAFILNKAGVLNNLGSGHGHPNKDLN